MITNRIRLKADVGSIKKGRVVDVFEGDGYWYIKDGKQNRTVIPTAHEVLLPKYVVKEKSGTYSIRKDYTVDGERLSIFIGGINTLEGTFAYSDVMKKYDNIIQKLMKRARGNTEAVTVIQPGDLELEELKKENEDLQVSYENMNNKLTSVSKEKEKLSKQVQSLLKEKYMLLDHSEDLERINQERAEKEKEMKQIIDKLEKENDVQFYDIEVERKNVKFLTAKLASFEERFDEIITLLNRNIESTDKNTELIEENSKGGIWSRLLGGK